MVAGLRNKVKMKERKHERNGDQTQQGLVCSASKGSRASGGTTTMEPPRQSGLMISEMLWSKAGPRVPAVRRRATPYATGNCALQWGGIHLPLPGHCPSAVGKPKQPPYRPSPGCAGRPGGRVEPPAPGWACVGQPPPTVPISAPIGLRRFLYSLTLPLGRGQGSGSCWQKEKIGAE